MTSEVFAVGLDTSLSTAARLLAIRHITGVPVVGRSGAAVGVISQSDLVDPDRDHKVDEGTSRYYRISRGALESIGDVETSGEGTVADVMSPYVLSVSPATSVLAAARIMVLDNVHRLLVIDRGRLIGIVTSMDVLGALLKSEGAL